MKKNTHPKTYNVKVKCSCGNSFEVSSTRETLHTEVCYACHPFYTGKSNVVDMTGQVDKFRKRQKRTTKIKENNKKVTSTKSSKKKPSLQKKENISEKKAPKKENKKDKK